MNRIISVLAVFGATVLSLNVNAQSADQILGKADSVLNAANDAKVTSTMTITDKGGAKRERTLELYQKGNDKRLVRFLTPADQKGIAFLSLPGDNQFLYLPAFGKVRRIASHVKNTKFAGTDYSYEDLEAKRYTAQWDASLKSKNASEYVLTLKPKKGTKSDYGQLEITIKADSYYPVRVEFFSKKGVAVKRLTVKEIGKYNGVLMPKDSEMADLQSGSTTRTVLQGVEVNKGLKDEVFTERNLAR